MRVLVSSGDTQLNSADDHWQSRLSPVGNWNDYQIDSDGDDNFTDAADLDQDRTHNLVNGIACLPDPGAPGHRIRNPSRCGGFPTRIIRRSSALA